MIDVKNISKSYDNFMALNNISLNIEKGSICGFLGPNGAGKTTLIRIIAQIITSDSGVIRFNSELLNHRHLRYIGYLPEDRGLYKQMKVGEHVIYFALLKGLGYNLAKKELKYWFAKWNISDWWDKSVEDLSKGMQQKIQFISSVIHKPEILILDEPFSGLDPINAELLKREIIELNSNGTTIIISTHHMESVEDLCKHIVLINKGELILSDCIYNIKQRYKHSIYKMSFSKNYDSFILKINSYFDLIDISFNENLHHIRIRPKLGYDINKIFESNLNDIGLVFFMEELPTMKDIFIQLVGK